MCPVLCIDCVNISKAWCFAMVIPWLVFLVDLDLPKGLVFCNVAHVSMVIVGLVF